MSRPPQALQAAEDVKGSHRGRAAPPFRLRGRAARHFRSAGDDVLAGASPGVAGTPARRLARPPPARATGRRASSRTAARQDAPRRGDAGCRACPARRVLLKCEAPDACERVRAARALFSGAGALPPRRTQVRDVRARRGAGVVDRAEPFPPSRATCRAWRSRDALDAVRGGGARRQATRGR